MSDLPKSIIMVFDVSLAPALADVLTDVGAKDLATALLKGYHALQSSDMDYSLLAPDELGIPTAEDIILALAETITIKREEEPATHP